STDFTMSVRSKSVSRAARWNPPCRSVSQSPDRIATAMALQPMGRQRRPSARIAVARDSPSSRRIAGTPTKTSATVPPTQTQAERTWRIRSTVITMGQATGFPDGLDAEARQTAQRPRAPTGDPRSAVRHSRRRSPCGPGLHPDHALSDGRCPDGTGDSSGALLERRQVALLLPLGDLDAVLVPFASLELDVAREDVLAERAGHEIGAR